MNNWTKIKISIFVIISIGSVFYTTGQIGEKPPFFIYPVVTIAAFIFSLGFFKGTSIHKKLTIGAMRSPLKDIFHNPLPFYHFTSIALFLSGIVGLIRDLIKGFSSSPISLFELSFSIGVYSSVIIANKYFIKEPKKLKRL